MPTTAKAIHVDLLIENSAELVTCVPTASDAIGRIHGGSVAIAADKICAIGTAAEVRELVDISDATIIDATGKVVAPGFIDCHTHLNFGGSRVKEYSARLTKSAVEVASMDIPCGIAATVQMTRSEDEDTLAASAMDRLDQMLRAGTTTAEIKSGYGLSLDHELKMLRVNRRLQDDHPIDIVSTYLGAHDFPADTSRKIYIDNILYEQIPAVADQGLAAFCDIYCDTGYYTVEESRKILGAGLDAGLMPKIHTDAYANIGGSEMAADMEVISADHLNFVNKNELGLLRAAGVVAVVMPALDFAVGHTHPFNAREIIDAGLTLALATDFCPGCWTESMQFVMVLACRQYGISPAEAMSAATMGAAKALRLETDRGSLEVGKLADLQIWNVATFEDVVYRLDHNVVESVIKRGEICF